MRTVMLTNDSNVDVLTGSVLQLSIWTIPPLSILTLGSKYVPVLRIWRNSRHSKRRISGESPLTSTLGDSKRNRMKRRIAATATRNAKGSEIRAGPTAVIAPPGTAPTTTSLSAAQKSMPMKMIGSVLRENGNTVLAVCPSAILSATPETESLETGTEIVSGSVSGSVTVRGTVRGTVTLATVTVTVIDSAVGKDEIATGAETDTETVREIETLADTRLTVREIGMNVPPVKLLAYMTAREESVRRSANVSLEAGGMMMTVEARDVCVV
jgi:hypothetical protein